MLQRSDATLQGSFEPQANDVREWWIGGKGERAHTDNLRAWNIVWIMVGNFYVKITGGIADNLPLSILLKNCRKMKI
jgi:hypothetical protein